MELSGTAKHRHVTYRVPAKNHVASSPTLPGILKPIPTDVFQHENDNNCYNFTFIFTINSPALLQFGPCCIVIV